MLFRDFLVARDCTEADGFEAKLVTNSRLRPSARRLGPRDDSLFFHENCQNGKRPQGAPRKAPRTLGYKNQERGEQKVKPHNKIELPEEGTQPPEGGEHPKRQPQIRRCCVSRDDSGSLGPKHRVTQKAPGVAMMVRRPGVISYRQLVKRDE